MIIENRVKAVAGIYASNAVGSQKSVKKETSGQPADEILLSSEAQSFSQILQRAQSMTDIRQDKVNAYTAQISAGQYQVDAAAVADKMLNTRF